MFNNNILIHHYRSLSILTGMQVPVHDDNYYMLKQKTSGIFSYTGPPPLTPAETEKLGCFKTNHGVLFGKYFLLATFATNSTTMETHQEEQTSYISESVPSN